jgi:hypothetical protein
VNLSLSLQLFACPFLGPRIRGIHILNNVIEELLRTQARLSFNSRSYTSDKLLQAQSKWLSSATLSSWLTANKVIELALGDPACAPNARASRAQQRKGSHAALAAAARASYEEQNTSSAAADTASAGTTTATGAGNTAATTAGEIAEEMQSSDERAAAAAATALPPPPPPAQASPRMLPPPPLNRVLSGVLTAKPSVAHVEILKRSEKLLFFAVHNGLLTARHIDLLWAAAGAQADAQQRVVYSLAATLSTVLDTAGLQRLYTHLCALPQQLEEAQVELIREVALSAAKSAETAADTAAAAGAAACLEQALDLLWQAVQEDAPVTPAVADAASVALAQVLRHADSAPLLSDGALEPAAGSATLRTQSLRRLLRLCVDNVRAGRSVAASLLLLNRLTDAQPQFVQSSHVTCYRLLSGLERDHKIIDLVVADLVAYRGRAADALAVKRMTYSSSTSSSSSSTALADKGSSSTASVSALDVSSSSTTTVAAAGAAAAAAPSVLDAVLEGRLSHSKQVTARLDFLLYVCGRAAPELPYEAVAELWGCFVQRPLCPEERELFFKWLQLMVPTQKPAPRLGICNTCSVQTLSTVFSELLCSSLTEWSNLGLAAYECLERFFQFVNTHSDALGQQEQNGQLIVTVKQPVAQLQGLAALWHVFQAAADDAVASAAGGYLISLHISSCADDTAAVEQARADAADVFISHCLEMAQASSSSSSSSTSSSSGQAHDAGGASSSSSSSTLVQRRALVLLSRFLKQVRHSTQTLVTVIVNAAIKMRVLIDCVF